MSIENQFSQLIILLATVFLVSKLCSGYDFNQAHTGVIFSPYIKYPYTEGHFDLSENIYTTTEIEMMLEVIAERFSNFVTFGAGALNVSYVNDSTYNHSVEEALVSRVAANINHKSGKKKLAMLQGIRYFDHNPRMETELKLAIECAEKANSLFPGTVEGFLFSRHITTTNFNETEEILKLIRELKNSHVSHLKIGTRMDSDLVYSYNQNSLGQYESNIVTAILRESSFVIFALFPNEEVILKGVEFAFEVVGDDLLKIRKQLRKSYTKNALEIFAEIGWKCTDLDIYANVKNLQVYWELADQWARDNNFPIRYYMAFDNPNIEIEWRHSGWWEIISNFEIDVRTGCIEKISVLYSPPASPYSEYDSEFRPLGSPYLPPNLTEILTATPIAVNNTTSDSTSFSETLMSNMYIAGGALGSLCLFILLIFVVILYLRVKTLQQKLSKQDIKEFKKGLSEKAVSQQDAYIMNTSALTIPYEKSFEIRKDQLKIRHDKILGMGEFGCVFKAQIESLPDGCKDVALKMAKDGCTRSALKGILSEIKLLVYIGQHPNIIRLIGAYTSELEKGIVYIATELCDLGSLQSYLRNHKKIAQAVVSSRSTAINSDPGNPASVSALCVGISFHQMVQWSLEIASGMEYLGTKNVVHADLATRNVLLSFEKTAKIADFGLSRRMFNYTNYVKTQQEPLPWRWMAIESLKISEFSSKSDVWSYGVTLWEIFSLGDQPYPGHTLTTGFVNMLVDGLRLESPKSANPKLYQLMLNCWNIDADYRPCFTYLRRLIENLKDQDNKTNFAATKSEDEISYQEVMI